MKLKLVRNSKDGDMIEMWNEKGKTLYCVAHEDMFWDEVAKTPLLVPDDLEWTITLKAREGLDATIDGQV